MLSINTMNLYVKQGLDYVIRYVRILEAGMVKGGHKGKQGFTLVELMVVVAVIAILAGIAMPQFMTAADKAKSAKEVADMQIIKNATQLYMIDKNVDTAPTVENLYKEGYLTENVKTPKGGNYTISYESVDGNSGKSVVIKSSDGK